MRTSKFALVLVLGALAVFPAVLRAQGNFMLVTGKTFDSAVPRDFYLEGNAIPTEKRNAALVKTPGGARVLFALIDTSGYSSDIKKKYIGMVIAEGKISICGQAVGIGSYGFGLDKPAPDRNEDATFNLYNQSGEKVASCASKKELALKQPRPLEIVLSKNKPASLYLGRYALELR